MGELQQLQIGLDWGFITFSCVTVFFVGLALVIRALPILWLLPAIMLYKGVIWGLPDPLMGLFKFVFWTCVVLGFIVWVTLPVVRQLATDARLGIVRNLARLPIIMVSAVIVIALVGSVVHDRFFKSDPRQVLLQEHQFWTLIVLGVFGLVLLFRSGTGSKKAAAVIIALLVLPVVIAMFYGYDPQEQQVPGVSNIEDPTEVQDDSGDVCDYIDGSPDSHVDHSLPHDVVEVKPYGDPGDNKTDCFTVHVVVD